METVSPHLIRIKLGYVNAFLWTGDHGPTLIDTGMPWTLNTLVEALQAANVQPSDLQRIIITHADIDHMGGLKGLLEMSDAVVACHTVAAPFITGERPLPRRKGLAGVMLGVGQRVLTGLYKPFIPQVQELLLDKEQTPEGFTVIYMPGHCPGQIALYHKEERLILLADALDNRNNRVSLTPRLMTINEALAIESLGRLKRLKFDTACFGHGDCITVNADAQIRTFIERLH